MPELSDTIDWSTTVDLIAGWCDGHYQGKLFVAETGCVITDELMDKDYTGDLPAPGSNWMPKYRALSTKRMKIGTATTGWRFLAARLKRRISSRHCAGAQDLYQWQFYMK